MCYEFGGLKSETRFAKIHYVIVTGSDDSESFIVFSVPLESVFIYASYFVELYKSP